MIQSKESQVPNAAQIKPLKKELLLFLLAGGSAVATDGAVYFGLFNSGINHSVAKSISFCAGSLVAYILNKYLTFNSPNRSMTEVLRFIALYLTTLAVNTSVNAAALAALDQKMAALPFLRKRSMTPSGAGQ